MVYQVKYKCHFYIDDMNNYVPHITYKYKMEGKKRWKKKVTQPIDKFAYYAYGEYYGSRAGGTDSYLYMKDHTRMKTMRSIIDEQYNGNLEEYVKDMVKFDIETNRAKNDMNYETLNIALSFMTGGWQQITIVSDTKEYNDEKLN